MISGLLDMFYCGPKVVIPPPSPSSSDDGSLPSDQYRNQCVPEDPPGLAKPATRIHCPYPLRTIEVMRADTEEKAIIKVCTSKDLEVFHYLGLNNIAHSDTYCNCFLSRMHALASWPQNEMDLHYSAYKVLQIARRFLTISFLRSKGSENLQDLVRILVFEDAETIAGIAEAARLGGQFPDEDEAMRFVELCIEFFLLFEIFACRRRKE